MRSTHGFLGSREDGAVSKKRGRISAGPAVDSRVIDVRAGTVGQGDDAGHSDDRGKDDVHGN